MLEKEPWILSCVMLLVGVDLRVHGNRFAAVSKSFYRETLKHIKPSVRQCISDAITFMKWTQEQYRQLKAENDVEYHFGSRREILSQGPHPITCYSCAREIDKPHLFCRTGSSFNRFEYMWFSLLKYQVSATSTTLYYPIMCGHEAYDGQSGCDCCCVPHCVKVSRAGVGRNVVISCLSCMQKRSAEHNYRRIVGL